MKKYIFYPLIFTLTLGASGGGTYLFRLLTDKRPDQPIAPIVDNPVPIEPVEEPGFSKMINKLMETKEILSKESSLTVKSTSNEDINIKLSDLDIDITNLLNGDISLKALDMKCTLAVSYSSIAEELSLIIEDENLYLNHEDKYFSFDVPNSIASIISLIDKTGVSLPSISDPMESIDMSSITEQGLALLENVKEEQTDTGFTYTLDLSPIIDSLDLSFSISNPVICMVTNSDYDLVGIKTIGDGIKIADDYTIAVDLNSLVLSSSSTYQKLTDSQKSTYQDLSSSTSNICTTIANLMDKKNFKADYSIYLKSSDDLDMTLSGDIQADLTSIKDDVKKGTYQVNLDHGDRFKTLNSAYALYKNNNIYLTVNDLIRGKVSNKTVDDLVSLLDEELPESDSKGVMDEINEVIAGSDFEKLLSGDLSVYRNFLVDYYRDIDGFSLVLDSSFFNFGTNYISITLKDVTSEISDGFSLSIKGIEYQNYALDVSMIVKSQDQVDIRYSDEDLSSFKDYSSIVPIFSTISDLFDKRKFNSTYSMYLKTDDKSYTFSGDIDADLSSLSLQAEEKCYGKYALTLDTSLNGFDHSVALNYQDHDLYMSIDSFFHQVIEDTEIGKMKEVLDKNIDMSSSAFDDVDELLKYVTSSDGLKEDLLGDLTSTYSLLSLESFLSIDENNTDPDRLIVELNLPYIFKNTSIKDKVKSLKIELDTDTKRITALKVIGLSINSLSIDFTLNLEEEYTPFEVKDEDKRSYVRINDLDKYLAGFFSLPTDRKKFSLDLDGSVKREGESENLVSLEGHAAADVTSTDAPVIGGKVDLYQPKDDTHNYMTDHQVRFSYLGDHTSGQTIAEYSAIDSTISNPSTMHLVMKNEDIFSIFSKVTSLSKKKDNLMYKYLKGFFETGENIATGMPLLDAIKSKDYSLLLNDYIKKVEISERRITLILSPSLLDESDTTSREDKVVVDFDSQYRIQKATISGYYSSYEINATISLSDYDESKMPEVMAYNDSTKQSFVDMHGFDMLISCFITTTDHHFFDLSATLSMNMSLLGLNLTGFTTYCTFYLEVQDENVLGYLAFHNNDAAITDSSFYGTEFFIDHDMAYSARTRYVDKKPIVELLKIKDKELLNNIIYYLLEYIMNLDSMKVLGISVGKIIIGNVYGQMASSSSDSAAISRNYSGLIQRAIYTENSDGSGTFDLSLLLSNLISVSGITFKSVTADVNFDSRGELSSLDVNASITAYSLINADVSLKANRNCQLSLDDPDFEEKERAIIDDKMKRYHSFVNLWNSDFELSRLDYYQITDVKAIKHWLYQYNGIDITDNGNKVTRNFSEDTCYLFYGFIKE